MMILLFACTQPHDSGLVGSETISDGEPYIATESAVLEENLDARWLIEYANATDVQFLFSSQDDGLLQFSVFSAQGELLWAVESTSPANDSFVVEPDCVGSCSFVAKAVLLSSGGEVELSLNVLASAYEAVHITPLP